MSGLPVGCQYTLQNQGADDELDSDVDLNGLGPCTYITGGEFDSTYDAGLLILAELGNYVCMTLMVMESKIQTNLV
ncbi:MAG: hypothetical protein IPG79_04985 [Saprospiraceae bacterium]|nr:hypothetical protein [Saprospiraceae bacterium]